MLTHTFSPETWARIIDNMAQGRFIAPTGTIQRRAGDLADTLFRAVTEGWGTVEDNGSITLEFGLEGWDEYLTVSLCNK